MKSRLFKKLILITLIICLVRNAFSTTCMLDTDCLLTEYNHSIAISNIENADYQCHIQQTYLSDKHPIHTIYLSNSGKVITRRNFGENNANEGNIYVSSNMLHPNRDNDLLVGAEQSHYSAHYYLFKPLSELATITVHCKKI